MKLSPVTWLVFSGVVVVAGFIGGRITSSRSNGVNENPETSVRAADDAAGGDFAVSRGGAANAGRAGKATAVKNAMELRDELKKLRESGYTGLKYWKELSYLLDRLDASDTAALMQEFAQGPLSPADMQGMGFLFGAMAEKDPEAAWRLGLTLEPPMKNYALNAAITALAEGFPDAALAKLDRVDSPTVRHFLRSSLLHTIAQNDPQRALALIGTAPKSKDQHLMYTIFGTWARRDLQAAQAAAEALGENEKERAIGVIVSTITETDPAAAWKLATESTQDSQRYNQYSIIQQWAHIDPQAALKAVETLEDKKQRERVLGNVFGTWVYTDYDAAHKHILGVSDPAVLAKGISSLANVQGSDCAALFKTLVDRVPAGEHFRDAMSSLVGQWTSQNPGEVAAALAQLPPGEMLTNAMQQFASQWYREAKDKNEPLQWALSMRGGEARNRTLTSVFSSWASKDPIAAVTAATNLSNEGNKDDLVKSITSSWSYRDPQAAMDWAARQPDSDLRQDILRSTLRNIAGDDPTKAVASLNSLGMSNDAKAVSQIVDRWARNDLEGASDWVKQLPDGEVRNSSLQKVADSLSGDNPEAAIAWALAISDSKSRTSAIEDVVQTWKRHDAQAAEAWVRSSNLPEETQNKLLEK